MTLIQEERDTTYSGSVTYELAEIGTRFIAIVIDNIILGVATAILFGAGRGAGAGVSFIVGLAYYWYFWTRQNGQSPGKQIMNIRVVKADGTPIGDGEAVLRYVGYTVNSVVLMLGWLWALWDPNRQGWHDKLAKTYVVKADPAKRKVEDFDKPKRSF
jgi:uncharacterized RDD family membrane protein YckC